MEAHVDSKISEGNTIPQAYGGITRTAVSDSHDTHNQQVQNTNGKHRKNSMEKSELDIIHDSDAHISNLEKQIESVKKILIIIKKSPQRR